MKLVNWRNLEESQGNLVLIYSPAGGGKTATTLQTAEDPITYWTAEKRKIKTTMAAINRPDLRMKVGVYEGFNDFIETVFSFPEREAKNEIKTKTCVLDSLTHLMAAQLAYEILDQNWDAKTEAERDEIIKELTMQNKMSKESYGALADNMLRLMNGLQNLTMAGYEVICTARSAERPKYNKTVGYGPALSGQKFGFEMTGYFDLIGMLEAPVHGPDDVPPPYNAPTEVLWKYHAPLASWNTVDDYLAKWTGPHPPKGIIRRRLHIKKLIAEANGIF